MWYMPDYPVAIDGRNDLYGDELDQLFYASQSAEAGYTTDPYLNEAGVVVLAADLPLAKILHRSIPASNSSIKILSPLRLRVSSPSIRPLTVATVTHNLQNILHTHCLFQRLERKLFAHVIDLQASYIYPSQP